MNNKLLAEITNRLVELKDIDATKTISSFSSGCGMQCGGCDGSCDTSCEGSCHHACEDNCSDGCSSQNTYL